MLIADTFEPKNLLDLIEQVIPVSQASLNSMGYADYQWTSCLGHTIQVERKQIDEILSGMDDVEEQLRRELPKTDEMILMYEGDCEPFPNIKSMVQTWKTSRNGQVLVPGRKYNISYIGFQSWLWQLDKAGISVYHTCDWVGSAYALTAWYQNSQKMEHTTLRRYIKEHIYPEPVNPHIYNLMALKGVNLGEERAKALIERYGTFWYTIHQTPEDIAETLVGSEEKGYKKLGMTTAIKLLKVLKGAGNE